MKMAGNWPPETLAAGRPMKINASPEVGALPALKLNGFSVQINGTL